MSPVHQLLVGSHYVLTRAVHSLGKKLGRGLGGPPADGCFPASFSNSKGEIMVEISPCTGRCVVMVSIEALDGMLNAWSGMLRMSDPPTSFP